MRGTYVQIALCETGRERRRNTQGLGLLQAIVPYETLRRVSRRIVIQRQVCPVLALPARGSRPGRTGRGGAHFTAAAEAEGCQREGRDLAELAGSCGPYFRLDET